MTVNGPGLPQNQFVGRFTSAQTALLQLGIFSYGFYTYEIVGVRNTLTNTDLLYNPITGSFSVTAAETNKGQCGG